MEGCHKDFSSLLHGMYLSRIPCIHESFTFQSGNFCPRVILLVYSCPLGLQYIKLNVFTKDKVVFVLFSPVIIVCEVSPWYVVY